MSEPSRPGPPLRIQVPPVAPQLRQFLADEAGSAGLLLAATVVALLWINSPFGATYHDLWATKAAIRVGGAGVELDLKHWINDAGMTIFFLVVGLEINREVGSGELRDRRMVAVPALGAVGGLALPGLIYWLFNLGSGTAHGWGIVVSTDTAFVLGVLALFGPRCPDRLRLFLLTLAIVDDIGAIGVMAIFYTRGVHPSGLIASGVLVVAFAATRWIGVWRMWPYAVLTVALWFCVLAAGVHPTLAGVLAGLLVPSRRPREDQAKRLGVFGRAVKENPTAGRARLAMLAVSASVATSERLERALHPWSAYLVVPLFGLANAGVRLDRRILAAATTSPVTVGVVVALVVGNAIGIALTSAVVLRTGLGVLPGRVRYSHLIGAASLAGIGFTISLFITELAFTDAVHRDEAKIGILAGSLIAAVIGSTLLRILGERLPMCSPESDEMPPLPPLPWRTPEPS